MPKRLLLYLTDDEGIFFTDTFEEHFKGCLKEALHYFETQVHQKTLLRLLIDRSFEDIREEKLPPLYPWERLQLLAHKRTEILAKGGFAGFQFLREGSYHYLRWIHISQIDPINPFLSRATDGVFFVPLEGAAFLKREDLNSVPYQVLVYPIISSKIRHVVYKGQRMLLSRLSPEGDDIRASLHYLSRTHPDILEMFHVKQLPDCQILLKSIASQRYPIFPFNIKSPFFYWMRIGGKLLFLLFFMIIILEIHRGVSFKDKELEINSSITRLKTKIENIKMADDFENLRDALNHYIYLKSFESNPINNIQTLFPLLEKHHIRLVTLEWHQGKEIDLILTFLKEENLAQQLDPFLVSYAEAFPDSQIQVIEAPYNSHFHEIYKGIDKTFPPLSHIRIKTP